MAGRRVLQRPQAPPCDSDTGSPYQHGPARYLEGSLCRRIRDPAFLRPAQLTQTRTATHSNVPPTVSSDQLLLAPLGHTSVVGDRPPHVGALSTSGGYKASPCGALPASGLGLDWFPSISRDMGRPRTQGCQERTTFRPPPQGPDSDWTHPRRLQCHPGADPIAPECSSSTGLGHVPAGSRPSSGRNRRSVSDGTYALTAPPRISEARVHDGPTAV